MFSFATSYQQKKQAEAYNRICMAALLHQQQAAYYAMCERNFRNHQGQLPHTPSMAYLSQWYSVPWRKTSVPSVRRSAQDEGKKH